MGAATSAATGHPASGSGRRSTAGTRGATSTAIRSRLVPTCRRRTGPDRDASGDGLPGDPGGNPPGELDEANGAIVRDVEEAVMGLDRGIGDADG